MNHLLVLYGMWRQRHWNNVASRAVAKALSWKAFIARRRGEA